MRREDCALVTQAHTWGGDFQNVAGFGQGVNLSGLGCALSRNKVAEWQGACLHDGPGAGKADGFQLGDGLSGSCGGGPGVVTGTEVIGPVAVAALGEDGVGGHRGRGGCTHSDVFVILASFALSICAQLSRRSEEARIPAVMAADLSAHTRCRRRRLATSAPRPY